MGSQSYSHSRGRRHCLRFRVFATRVGLRSLACLCAQKRIRVDSGGKAIHTGADHGGTLSIRRTTSGNSSMRSKSRGVL